jgi:hypothetical protein
VVRTVLGDLQIKWRLFCGKRERERKNPARAMQYFEKVVAADPLRATVFAQMGSCFYDLQREPI